MENIWFKVIDNLARRMINGNKIYYQNNNVTIRKEYRSLIFQKRVVDDIKKKYLYHVDFNHKKIIIREIGREVDFSVRDSVSRFEDNKLYLDLDKVRFPILIRSRKSGDHIRLRNLGVKKLKTIFINDKVPRDRRDKVPNIVINDEIAGIFSIYYGKKNRIAEGYMISESTRKILICELSGISQS